MKSAPQRLVAGMLCGQVLAQLSAYLDGELDADTRQRIEAHVTACDWCARFGAGFSATVEALRRSLAVPAPLDHERANRLKAYLNSAL